jgi:hypothetical protein
MLGYVRPEKSELRVREFETYGAYYCGICRSIGVRYGQTPRLLLSYDAVFLAMLLSALSETPDRLTARRCPIHPTQKRGVAEATPILDYAADIMLLLGYFKLKDDRRDEKKPIAFAGEWLLRSAYRKVCAARPEKAERIGALLEELNEWERETRTSFDRAAEPFALLMEEVMDYPDLAEISHSEPHENSLRYACRRIGRHLGKWIYLMDAFDDIEQDLSRGAFNPLLRNHDNGRGVAPGETAAAFRDRIRERVRLNASLYLSEIEKLAELLPIRKNKDILENILYVGLLRKTEEVVGARPRQTEPDADGPAENAVNFTDRNTL